jgi:hypothetical protein
MYNVDIILVICSVDFTTGSRFILSKNKDKLELPTTPITDNIQEELQKMIYESTSFNSLSNKIDIKHVAIDGDTVKLYYLAKIPYASIINGFWIKDIVVVSLNPDIENLIKYV